MTFIKNYYKSKLNEEQRAFRYSANTLDRNFNTIYNAIYKSDTSRATHDHLERDASASPLTAKARSLAILDAVQRQQSIELYRHLRSIRNKSAYPTPLSTARGWSLNLQTPRMISRLLAGYRDCSIISISIRRATIRSVTNRSTTDQSAT